MPHRDLGSEEVVGTMMKIARHRSPFMLWMTVVPTYTIAIFRKWSTSTGHWGRILERSMWLTVVKWMSMLFFADKIFAGNWRRAHTQW